MYYAGYFEMGKYVELSIEGGCVPCTVVSLSWHNFLGCGCLCFQRWFDGTSVSFDKQNLSGNDMHNKKWKDGVLLVRLNLTTIELALSLGLRSTFLLGLTTMKTMKVRIPSFFTNFITTPVLSGPLYISPDMYHTQVTEYLLEKLNEWALFSL